jgi:hypothetical protein
VERITAVFGDRTGRQAHPAITFMKSILTKRITAFGWGAPDPYKKPII